MIKAFRAGVTLDQLCKAIPNVIREYSLTGTEIVQKATVVGDDHDPDAPYGTIMLQINDGDRVGTIAVSPKRLSEKPN